MTAGAAAASAARGFAVDWVSVGGRFRAHWIGYELLGAAASVSGSLDDLSFFSLGPTLGGLFRF